MRLGRRRGHTPELPMEPLPPGEFRALILAGLSEETLREYPHPDEILDAADVQYHEMSRAAHGTALALALGYEEPNVQIEVYKLVTGASTICIMQGLQWAVSRRKARAEWEDQA